MNIFETFEVIIGSSPYATAAIIIGGALVAALVILPFVNGILMVLTRKTQTDLDDTIRATLQKPIFYTVLLVGMRVALGVLPLSETLHFFAEGVVYSLIVLTVAQGIVRVAKVLIQGLVQTTRASAVNTQTAPLFSNVVFGVVIAAALYALFLVWGIDVTAWLASAGIIGIAVGFAAKDTLSNLISGIFVLADKPYSIGDYIVLPNGTMGIVENIGLRSTRVRTFDDEEVTIPNGVIANDVLINKSTGPESGRVKVVVGVAYGTDTRTVESLLLEMARAHEKVLAEPEPSVFFTDFGDSALTFMLSCRVADPLDVFGVQSDLRFAINETFAQEKIEIPFPQRDVHMRT